tara:strand:+ start:2001 stop:2216 length:216 start_codon:yes stop_codon:yes gene_type:complete
MHFENEVFYQFETISRLDGKKLSLHGTSYTVNCVTLEEEDPNGVTVLYSATNESGTKSYGEIAKEEISTQI